MQTISENDYSLSISAKRRLAGIILAIREAVKYKDLTDDKDPNYKYTEIFTSIKWLSVTDWTVSLWTNEKQLKQDLKQLIKDKHLKYEKEWWLDDELGKVAKILCRADRSQLDTFATLLQEQSDIATTAKEWKNAIENKDIITTDNVFEFLCDFNDDGTLQRNTTRRTKKEKNRKTKAT